MAKYWFRKRRGLLTKDLGWGWRPISTEGWLLTIAFVVGIFYFISVYRALNLTNTLGFKQYLFMIGALFVFMYIADKKTEDKVLFK